MNAHADNANQNNWQSGRQPIKPTKKTDDIHTTNLELSPKLLAVGARLIVCVLNAHIAWQNIKIDASAEHNNGFGDSEVALALIFCLRAKTLSRLA